MQHAMLITGAHVLLVSYDTQPSTPSPRGSGYKTVMQHAVLVVARRTVQTIFGIIYYLAMGWHVIQYPLKHV